MPTTLELERDTSGLKWYQGLDRYCWIVLAIAALGWLFDTMDRNLMNLVRAPSLKEIFHPHPKQALTDQEKIDLDKKVKEYGGKLTSIFLLGWAAGGFIFGILGDRLGRTRTMILTILVYAIFPSVSGLVHSFGWYGFITI